MVSACISSLNQSPARPLPCDPVWICLRTRGLDPDFLANSNRTTTWFTILTIRICFNFYLDHFDPSYSILSLHTHMNQRPLNQAPPLLGQAKCSKLTSTPAPWTHPTNSATQDLPRILGKISLVISSHWLIKHKRWGFRLVVRGGPVIQSDDWMTMK